MSDFAKAFVIVWTRENGRPPPFIATSDDPDDPGGYTRGGIALNEHPGLAKADLDAFTMADFESFYQSNYWRPEYDQLSWPVNLMVFDGEVNEGAEGTIALQAALSVTQDGVIGPKTLATANASDPEGLAARMFYYRDAKYHSLAGFAHDGAGWIARLALNMYDAGKAS